MMETEAQGTIFSSDGNSQSQPQVSGSLNQLFSTGQIRLAEISLYNWGSFHGLHTGRIDPDGTLITGDNGSGKSTFIDGLMALLLPAGKATFNVAAAQGDRSDRSLMSYIRGSYGTAHDGGRTNTLNKRQGAVVSALRALYRAEDGSEITLSAVFWMTQPSNALKDLTRLYLVARRHLTLEELLRGFGSGNVRGLKQQLRADPLVTLCDDHFAEYQETYSRLLRMDNRNAPALLSRALGLKKIDDLTDLIRKLVLEPSRIQEDARKAVTGFDDLVGIHNELLTARAQRDMLAPLPELADKLRQATASVANLSEQLSALPVWFGEQRHRLWNVRIQQLEDKILSCAQQLEILEREEKDADNLVESRHADYIQAGGGRIETLRTELERHTDKLDDINKKAGNYQHSARKLALDTTLSRAVFSDNAAIIESRCERLEEEKEELLRHFGDSSAQCKNAEDTQRQLEDEIAEIKVRPDSNIPHKYQNLRDELSESLEIPKNQLMFLGELVDVAPEQKNWQGAIERALGGLRTTLAVPQDKFSLVTRWLNQRHTGLHVRMQVVRTVSGQAEFMRDGYLRKLQWRDHPYRDWLKHHLRRFDLHCVADTKALDNTPFSMTQQGLAHMEKGRFEKKDQKRVDDRRAWQLGFSNKDRLALLRQDLKEQQKTVEQCKQAVKQALKMLSEADQRAELWKKLAEYGWDDIDVPYWQGRVNQCRQELENLLSAGGDLETARQLWEAAKNELETIRKNVTSAKENKAVLTNQKDRAEDDQVRAAKAAAAGIKDEARTTLMERIGELVDDDLENSTGLEEEHRVDIDREKQKFSSIVNASSQRAVGIMNAFSQQWDHITAEWLRTIEGLPDYIGCLEKLDREGLPNLVDRFRERLTRHATQSLAAISQKMASEREEIEERIMVINQVLARTEFKKGTYLRLGAKTEIYPHVDSFKKQLRTVLQQAGSDDYEERFSNLKTVIEILDRATAVTTAGNLESLRLLDSRYQLSFFAEEIESDSNKVIDVLESSTGKSGGEKESFAGTVVAASLAYVLTPDGYDRPVYSTVFLDEAFSNTAESVSRRVLNVFRELHIHINLITPYKNLNLARESAKSLLIAERDQKNHESHLCEVTWEEIDRRLNSQALVQADAEQLGVEIQPVAGVE